MTQRTTVVTFFLMSHVEILTLDSITSFSGVIYVVKTSNCMRYSQKSWPESFQQIANTMENRKETNEFSLIFSMLESN